MQALTFDGKHPQLQANHPDPEPAPGEVLIRPILMGICSTDLELCQGYLGFAGVLGHEFVGEVLDASSGPLPGSSPGPNTVASSWTGKRVVGSISCVCARCDMCRTGLREHCRDRTVLGITGRDGCFAEAFTLPAQNLLEVPGHVDDDHAVFTEPLAAAHQILRQLTIEGRPYITVLGDGRLGLLCAQVLSQLNATVRCVGKYPDKLQHCEKWGVKHRLLDDVGLRNDQDIVVDCTGSPVGLPTALAMVRPRGTIVLKTTVAQINHSAVTDLAPIVINEIKVIGSRCGPFPDAIDSLSSQKVDVLSLISRRMKLCNGVEALKMAAKPGVLKVLLEP